MKKAFLIAALALPPNRMQNYHLLLKFLVHYNPGCEIVFVNRDETLKGKAVMRTPFVSHGLAVWLKKSA
jgi:hypothetical protein